MSSHGNPHTGHMPSSGPGMAISAWLTGIYFLIEMSIGLWTGSIAVTIVTIVTIERHARDTARLGEYASRWRHVSPMGRIEAGFVLIDRAEAKGLLSNSDNEGYPMLHNLIQACRFIGDLNSVFRAQAALDRLGLIALAPVATAVVQGSLRQYQNGNVGEGVVDAQQLWLELRDLRQQKPYKPQLQALPWDFLQKSTREQQEESLKLHAEKKALAMLLSNNVEDELSISINFNACMDCHEFFKISSQMLGRRIQLRQHQMAAVINPAC